MKKLLIITIMIASMLSTMTGCAQKTKCDFCADEKYCDTQTMWGEEVHICNECQEQIEALRAEFRAAGK